MGAGIANQIKRRYPGVYEYYRAELRKYFGKSALLGQDLCCYTGPDGGEVYIHNLITQYNPGADARYEYVFDALSACAVEAFALNGDEQALVAMPMIGCGIGGLEWDSVEKLVKAVEVLHPVEFEVWKL